MKNKYVSGVLLATAFCAATMTACGAYGAQEYYTEYQEPDQPDSQVVEEQETNDESEQDSEQEQDSEYDPELEKGLCVYGPPEDFE